MKRVDRKPNVVLFAMSLVSMVLGSIHAFSVFLQSLETEFSAPRATVSLTHPLLGLIGFTYGGTIAAYPVAIMRLFPKDDGPHVYGRAFTAWGVAGLLAPWIAGQLFDRTGGYDLALLVAAGFAILSALTARKSF